MSIQLSAGLGTERHCFFIVNVFILQLRHRLNPVEDLHQLEKEPEEFWLQLLKEYLLDSPSMTVRGYPSLEEQRRLAKNEKQRISEQQQKFGEKGLQELGYQLQQAMVENEVSCNSLHTHSSSFMRTGSHEV